jgi:hypothetical protein
MVSFVTAAPGARPRLSQRPLRTLLVLPAPRSDRGPGVGVLVDQGPDVLAPPLGCEGAHQLSGRLATGDHKPPSKHPSEDAKAPCSVPGLVASARHRSAWRAFCVASLDFIVVFSRSRSPQHFGRLGRCLSAWAHRTSQARSLAKDHQAVGEPSSFASANYRARPALSPPSCSDEVATMVPQFRKPHRGHATRRTPLVHICTT